MHIRSVAFIAALTLLACQFAPAQSAASPAQVLAKVVKTGQAAPVVAPGSVPAGAARPQVWLADAVSGPVPQITPFVLPSFCNVPRAGGRFNFCPTGVQTAYNTGAIIGGNGGAGMTIAIVDAFHYAGAEADLAAFDAEMGLPACTTANGCFTQVNQNGGPPGGPADNGWAVEVSLVRFRVTLSTVSVVPPTQVTKGEEQGYEVGAPLSPEENISNFPVS